MRSASGGGGSVRSDVVDEAVAVVNWARHRFAMKILAGVVAALFLGVMLMAAMFWLLDMFGVGVALSVAFTVLFVVVYCIAYFVRD